MHGECPINIGAGNEPAGPSGLPVRKVRVAVFWGKHFLGFLIGFNSIFAELSCNFDLNS